MLVPLLYAATDIHAENVACSPTNNTLLSLEGLDIREPCWRAFENVSWSYRTISITASMTLSFSNIHHHFQSSTSIFFLALLLQELSKNRMNRTIRGRCRRESRWGNSNITSAAMICCGSLCRLEDQTLVHQGWSMCMKKLSPVWRMEKFMRSTIDLLAMYYG